MRLESAVSRKVKIKAALIATGITALTPVYYYWNNSYDNFVASSGLIVNLFLYYILVQPIYVVFIVFFGLYIYQQDHAMLSVIRGVIAAILIVVSLDLISIPHSVPSLFTFSQTIQLSNDPNLTPYPDYQIAKAMSDGPVSLTTDLFVYIFLPIVLNIFALAIAKPNIYTKAFENAS
jgi:hypothetical protein